jgi:hypothetical protein
MMNSAEYRVRTDDSSALNRARVRPTFKAIRFQRLLLCSESRELSASNDHYQRVSVSRLRVPATKIIC